MADPGKGTPKPEPAAAPKAAPAAESAAGPHGASPSPRRVYEIKATGEEAKKYDFRAARTNIKTTTVLESVAQLIKSCLGAGIVGIHDSYRKCGLFSALIMNVFLGVFVAYCMKILIDSAQVLYGRLQVPAMSYPDLAEAALATGPFPKLRKCSKPFRYAVDFTIGLDLFGSCAVYAVIIARTLNQLVIGFQNGAEGDSTELHHVQFYLAGLILPIILICMITKFKYLAPFSIVANAFIFIVGIATIWYGAEAATQSPLEFPFIKGFVGVVEFIGVCVFSMEGVGVSLPIENHMKEPHKFKWVLIIGMTAVASMVMIVGFFGYWGFGEKSKAPVTLNFPWSWFSIVLKIFMALMIWVTFALNFWVPFELVWVYIQRRHNPEKYWYIERIYRAVIALAVVGVAIAFPNVTSFMGLLGSFCLSNMGFIFPAFIQLMVEWDDPGLGFMKWRLWRCVVIVTAGLILAFLGTYFNAVGMFKGAQSGGD